MNICAEYGLELSAVKVDDSTKVVENDRAKMLRDFPIQTSRLWITNQMSWWSTNYRMTGIAIQKNVILRGSKDLTLKLRERLLQIS